MLPCIGLSVLTLHRRMCATTRFQVAVRVYVARSHHPAPFPPSPPLPLTLRLSLSGACRLPDVEDLLSHCVPTTRCLSLPPHLRGPYPGPLEVPFPQELRDYTPSPLRFQSADGTQVQTWTLIIE